MPTLPTAIAILAAAGLLVLLGLVIDDFLAERRERRANRSGL